MTIRNLILTGGINHDFDDSANALADVLSEAGIDSEIFSDFDRGLEAIADGFDLVTVFALRWRMLDDDKYIPFRDEWAYEISDRHRTLLTEHVRQGGGLFGLHTAAICFDTWADWHQLLGAKWVWGESFHPEPASLDIITLESGHAATKGLDSFSVTDELYYNIQPADGAAALLQTRSTEDDTTQTLAWANNFGEGRTVYSALAHDRESIEAIGHKAFLKQAAQWCAGHL